MLDCALFYYELGFSIIPIKPRSKEPLVSWKEYQQRRPTREEIIEWWTKWPEANIAIITGSVSRILIVLDFDSEEAFIKFYNSLDEMGLHHLRDKILSTWIVETGKGIHVYFLIDVSPDTFSKMFRTKVRIAKDIDIKAEGGYVVAPPSTHPSGKQYRFRQGPPHVPEPAKLSLKEWKDLLKALGVETETEAEAKAGQAVEAVEARQKTGFKVLKPDEISEIAGLLRKAWVEGVRHELSLYLSGWLAHAKVHPVSAAELLHTIATLANDSELADRISTIYYSYKKLYGDAVAPELAELDNYINNLKAQGILKHVSKALATSETHVKGRSGVQEILEELVGEEEALEIIRRISEILGRASPFRDTVFFISEYNDDGNPKAGYVNNTRRLQIYKAVFTNSGVKPYRIVWDGAIVNVSVYKDPLTGDVKYEIEWDSKKTGGIKLGPASVDDIYERLKGLGFSVNKSLAYDALSSIIRAFINQGRAEVRIEIEYPGFYVVQGRIHAVKYTVRDVTPEELKEALLLLNELVEHWYRETREKFATVLKWGLVSPFIYARKQLGRQYQVPHLVLYGPRNTGKTTLAEIATIHLWGLERAKASFSGTQANTEARLGRVLSQSTFPIIINEANAVFDKNKPELINMLKNSVEELVSRGKYVKAVYMDIPALSGVIFTLNPSPPVSFEELALVPKTVYLITFSEGERLKPEKIDEFRNSVEPRLPLLQALGHFTARLVLERGAEFLKQDWNTLAETILTEAYKVAGLEPPSWILDNYKISLEEVEAERVEGIRVKLAKYIAEQITKTRIDGDSLELRLGALLEKNLVPFMIKQGNTVLITSAIISELKLEVESLRSLADMLGWRYVPWRTLRLGRDSRKTYSVIEVELEELARFISPALE